MEIRQGTLSSSLAVALASLAMACSSHLTKVQVAEVPLDQFQGTPVTAEQTAPQGPPIVGSDAPGATASTTTTTTMPATTAAVATAASTPAPGAASLPKPAVPPDSAGSADDKVRSATKLLNTGKRPDLLAARKILVADVGSGVGTQDEVKLLLRVCARLGDRPCIAKANSYVK